MPRFLGAHRETEQNTVAVSEERNHNEWHEQGDMHILLGQRTVRVLNSIFQDKWQGMVIQACQLLEWMPRAEAAKASSSLQPIREKAKLKDGWVRKRRRNRDSTQRDAKKDKKT